MWSACVSMWAESHKICKVWTLINQVLPWCFYSYVLWLNKSNHQVKQVNINKSNDINQSISVNQFYPIKALIFIREFFCFPIIHHNSVFLTHMKRVCYSNNWKAWHLCCSLMKLLMIIPDFGVSTAILNRLEISRRWCKLNFGLSQGHVKSRQFTANFLEG